jgi:hypothetical protein
VNVVSCAIQSTTLVGTTSFKRQLIKKLESEGSDFVFLQIKEKFGGLRIYVSYYDNYINGVIRMAEKMSHVTCEATGASGKLHIKGFCLKTLNESYASRNGFSIYDKSSEI